ncbi:MAG: hypothetical protein AB1487_02150 [Thermodesulfobacteriota bacterium]
MADSQGSTGKKPVGKMISFGIGSIILYAIVFSNEGLVTEWFTKGKWFAALPIITVFIFSFVHGTFASYLWSVLGLEVVKKK